MALPEVGLPIGRFWPGLFLAIESLRCFARSTEVQMQLATRNSARRNKVEHTAMCSTRKLVGDRCSQTVSLLVMGSLRQPPVVATSLIRA